MNSSLRTSSIMLLLAGGLALLAGPGRPANAQEVQASVMPGLVQVPPGEWFPVAVIFDMQPHWHINTDPTLTSMYAKSAADDAAQKRYWRELEEEADRLGFVGVDRGMHVLPLNLLSCTR